MNWKQLRLYNKMENEEKIIWKNCIERAIAYLDKNHWKNDSTKFDLVFKGKYYPTKPIIGKAFELVQQENPNIHIPSLKGGKPIKFFLEKIGFEVKEKEKIEHDNDFFNKLEFESINKSNGLLYDKSKPELSNYYSVLKTAYEKLHYLTEIVQKETFLNGNFNLIKKPTNQGNHFQGYLWSKIYPTKEDKDKKWLAFTLGLDSDFHYNFKIDTVGLIDSDVHRKKYLNYRGDFENSIIVFRPKFDAFNNWDELIDYCIEKLELLEPHYQKIKNISNSKDMIQDNLKSSPLNQILYGPPGTGKTYNTVNKAISIANPIFDLNQDRDILKKEYDRLVTANQIMFATFHQSMSYEDFIEGIKPKIEEDENENKQVVYEVEDGIFKRIVENAQKINKASKNITQPYSFDDAWNDLINEAEKKLEDKDPLFLSIQSTNLGLKVVEITGKGNLKLKPIYSDDAKEYTISYLRARKLQEVFFDLSVVKNIDKEFRAVIGGSNSTAYWAVLNYINEKINKYSKIVTQEENLPALPYVLIIDEINRGNVSAIFGELITLIEEDKRIGKPEALMVTLPYSKKPFGVPANLYLIGTMNTADRSVEALDTALRRRFSFEEMPPNYELPELSNELFGYPASKILKTINHRIEKLLDKDHTIGHSYFINKDDVSIVESFYKCIIPLLQEYFFGDYGKIGLVLGKGFVKLKEWDRNSDSFAVFEDYGNSDDFEERNVFEIIDYRNKNQIYKIKEIEMTFGLSIKLLMKGTIE